MLLTCFAPENPPHTGRGGATQRQRWDGLAGASDIDPFVLNLAQGGAPCMRPSAIAAAILIAASVNNLAKAGYAIGFGGRAAAERPTFQFAALALPT